MLYQPSLKRLLSTNLACTETDFSPLFSFIHWHVECRNINQTDNRFNILRASTFNLLTVCYILCFKYLKIYAGVKCRFYSLEYNRLQVIVCISYISARYLWRYKTLMWAPQNFIVTSSGIIWGILSDDRLYWPCDLSNINSWIFPQF